jgi:hypothetical protein
MADNPCWDFVYVCLLAMLAVSGNAGHVSPYCLCHVKHSMVVLAGVARVAQRASAAGAPGTSSRSKNWSQCSVAAVPWSLDFFYMALVGESHSNTWTTASLVALWNLHMNIVKLCACTITQVVHFSN